MEKNFLEKKEENKIKSVISWIDNKEWESDSILRSHVENIKGFVDNLPKEEIGLNLIQSFSNEYIKLFEIKRSGNIDLSQDSRNIIKNKFKDKIVIDLGVGQSFLKMLELIKNMEVKEFIGLEKFIPLSNEKIPTNNEIKNSLDLSIKESKEFGINGAFIYDDMLIFLSKLPDKSANFIMNGIDSNVIQSLEYWNMLSEEINRVSYDKGIITGYGSNFRNFSEFFTDIKNIQDNWLGDNFVILEKK